MLPHASNPQDDAPPTRLFCPLGPPEPIRLIALDIDGTLLRPDKRLSRNVRHAVRQACAAGVHVVLASARPPRSVRAVHEALGLTTCQINYNGALIHDTPTGRNLHHQPLPGQLLQQLIQLARRVDPRVAVSVENLDRWLTDRVDPQLLTETARTLAPDHLGPLESFWDQPATKLMLLSPAERLGTLHQRIAHTFAKQVSIMVSDSHLIQIVHPQVSKAEALARVAAMFDVPAQAVMAIGDAPNDAAMLRWAGWGVAMGNAWPAARAAADARAPSNENDGVAHAIRQWVL